MSVALAAWSAVDWVNPVKWDPLGPASVTQVMGPMHPCWRLRRGGLRRPRRRRRLAGVGRGRTTGGLRTYGLDLRARPGAAQTMVTTTSVGDDRSIAGDEKGSDELRACDGDGEAACYGTKGRAGEDPRGAASPTGLSP